MAVAPSVAVLWVIPRPFYQDDSTGITAVTGALQPDVTPFEKALQIRQMSLSMVQRAVAEDRIARANRTRTQQLSLAWTWFRESPEWTSTEPRGSWMARPR